MDNRLALTAAAINISNNFTRFNSFQDLVSDEVCRFVQWAVLALACQIVIAFGTLSNIINIACFLKLGFKESIDVYFFGLAISDLGSLLTLIFTNMCYTPTFQNLDLPFDPVEMQYLATGMPHIVFVRVTGLITALITLERCMCITMPLKVKSLFTPRRAALILSCLFAAVISCVSPEYYANTYTWTFSPERNRTILRLFLRPEYENDEKSSSVLSNVFLPVSSFLLVVVCTAALVARLKDKTKWREQATMSRQVKSISSRDQKVAKIVVVISGLFITCYVPVFLMFACIIFVPDVSIQGRNKNLVVVVGGCGIFFECTNAAMNFVIYYHMSSKYRTVFHHLFSFAQIY